MFKIIFDPFFINLLIKRIHYNKFNIGEILAEQEKPQICYFAEPYDNCCPVILTKHLPTLFYLVLDNNYWTFYHGNPSWIQNSAYLDNILSNDQFIKTTDISTALGFVANNKLEFVQWSDPKSGLSYNNFESYYYLDTIDDNIYRRINTNEDISEYKIISKCHYDNILLCGNQCIIYLNPPSNIANSLIDLFFTIINLSCNQKSDQIVQMMLLNNDKSNILTILNNFTYNLKIIQKSHPKPEYGLTHNLFRINDNEYYAEKINCFQSQIMAWFNNLDISLSKNSMTDYAKFVSSFIDNFRRDLVHEIYLLYHRWRCFPQERLSIYRKYPKHAYIKLIKLVHQSYTINKNPITTDDIFGLLENNTFLDTLIKAISQRSELFVDTYQIYTNTIRLNIRPKYKITHNYYPFKIFSPGLFIMEHLLANELIVNL